MSHPIPSHDHENERVEDSKFGPRKHKAKALKKAKEAPLGKLKRLLKESEEGRKDWKSMVGK